MSGDMSNIIRDISGLKFGRLTVVSLHPERTKQGGARWICKCSCGNETVVSLTNLNSGQTLSCGCLAKELSRARGKARKKPPQICSVDGCNNTTEKGGHGFCGKHYARYKRHGSPHKITPEKKRSIHLRNSMIKSKKAQSHTYKKFFGKHLHRVVVEKKLGRELLPDEIVHHIDGNKHNNSSDNLLIITQNEHASIHFKNRQNQ